MDWRELDERQRVTVCSRRLHSDGPHSTTLYGHAFADAGRRAASLCQPADCCAPPPWVAQPRPVFRTLFVPDATPQVGSTSFPDDLSRRFLASNWVGRSN